MAKIFTLAVLLCVTAFSLSATDIPIAFMSWDVNFPGNSGQFDVSDQTGVNSTAFPDTTWPVTNTVLLTGLSLTVHFNDGSTQTFGSSYFTTALDGQSLDGSPIAIGGTNPIPDSATLTGTFSTTSLTLNDGSTVTIKPAFSATITDSPTLLDGDFAVVAGSSGPSIPEPSSWAITGGGLALLWFLRRRVWSSWARKLLRQPVNALLAALVVAGCLATAQIASATTVNLNAATVPSSGVAGVNTVSVVGSGFAAGTITPANVNVTLATSCGGATVATTTATSVKTIIGSTRRVSFLIPSALATGNYFVKISDSALGDADFTSGNCSELAVTHTNATLSACLPTSSLGVLVPTKPGNVTAYVPNGCWSCGTLGLQVVNVEGPTSANSISTPNVVNSCSSNPATGQTVCVANNTDVYLITGTTLNNTLTSGSDDFASFSGGSCKNCGVAINALANKAVINMGLSTSPVFDGVQFLNLNTNTFETPVPLQTTVSENISVDPTRNLILSPNERNIYDLLQIQSDGSTVKEFENSLSTSGELDSAAEDCSTGIALASEEFTNNVFITDLTQATLTSGSPAGTWTAPNTNFAMVTSYGFSAGTSGIAVAPGSGHLAVVTGEFGGRSFAVLQLPSTSGSGTPTILDYAVALIPSSTECGTFSSGLDPHTVTAYTSPNDGKAYALFANNGASCLARIDLAAVLAATRGGTGLQAHDVSETNFPAGAATFFATH